MSQTDPVGILYKSIYKQDPVSNKTAFNYWNEQYDGGMSIPKLGIEMRKSHKENLTPWASDLLEASKNSAGLLAGASQPTSNAVSTQNISNQSSGLVASASNGANQPNSYQDSIKSLYQDLLGRDPGQAGLDFYVSKLQSGTSFDQLRNEIFNSEEARNYRYKYGQDRITQQGGNNPYADASPATDAMADQVANLYRQYLGRDPDQAGLNWWMQYAEQNGMAAAAEAFQNSQEVQGYRNPNLSTGSGSGGTGTGAGTGSSQNGGGSGSGWNSPVIPSDQIPGSWYDPETPRNGQYGQVDATTDPVVRQVNSETDTVQGQLNGLLQRQNPLMQRAYYKGLDMANSRGLLNSSMASEAAQAAMMDAALPIAQQDAQTYYDQGARNQGVMNEFNLNERQMQHDMAMQDSELGSQMAIERLKQNSGLYAQFLQGMSDINAADMDQGAKDTAMSSLWDAIQQGTSMATTLSGVRFEGGKLVYDDVPQGGSIDIGEPEVSQSDTTSMTWGDGGIYTSGVTRNSRGDLVDKNGNPAPETSSPNSSGGGQYELINGEWKAVGNNDYLPG